MLNISLYDPLVSTDYQAPTTGTTEITSAQSVVTQAQRLLRRALPAELIDDRFGVSWQQRVHGDATYWVAIASTSVGDPVAMLEHWREAKGNARLEFLLDQGYAAANGADAGLTVLTQLFRALDENLDRTNLGSNTSLVGAQLWSRPTATPVELFTEERSLALDRHLYQMRRDITSWEPPDRDESVAFQPSDADQLVAVNNRAFVDHPDQGTMTRASFQEAAAETWFRSEGLRIWRIDETIAAFCWTKIHKEPPLGEIYVIGVDPDFQGQGLGNLVTSAGIRWLKDNNQDTVMLYVEAPNSAAVALYTRLGFETVREDKAWRF